MIAADPARRLSSPRQEPAAFDIGKQSKSLIVIDWLCSSTFPLWTLARWFFEGSRHGKVSASDVFVPFVCFDRPGVYTFFRTWIQVTSDRKTMN